jgi:predicted lipoprotein with Yx(FWY)xxD motif
MNRMRIEAVATRTTFIAIMLAVLTAAVAAALVAVQGADAARSSMTPAIQARQTSLGRILVNSQGHTLYLFEKDEHGKSTCSGSCAGFWPPLIVKAKPTVGAGLSRSLAGTTKRADGRLQATYNGHPLYTFALDTKAGQTKGEGLDKFGAEWYVLSTHGTKIEKESSSGGYGS